MELKPLESGGNAGEPIGWLIVDQTVRPRLVGARFVVFTGCAQEMGAAYHLLNLEELDCARL